MNGNKQPNMLQLTHELKDGTQGNTSTCAFKQGRVVYAEQWLSQKNNVQKCVIYTVAESK